MLQVDRLVDLLLTGGDFAPLKIHQGRQVVEPRGDLAHLDHGPRAGGRLRLGERCGRGRRLAQERVVLRRKQQERDPQFAIAIARPADRRRQWLERSGPIGHQMRLLSVAKRFFKRGEIVVLDGRIARLFKIAAR